MEPVNVFPLNETKTPKSEINKPFHSRTLPEEPRPFISKKQPEFNTNAFNYKGVDSSKANKRQG